MTPSTRLYIVLGLTIFIWGNSFVVVQLAIDDGASPTLIAMARFIVASAIFGGYIVVRRPSAPDKSDMKLFLLLAFVGVGVYYIFQYYGVKFAGPSISSVLLTLLCPVMIFLLSYFKLGERMTLGQKAGLGVAALGSYFVITDGTVAFVSNWEMLVGGAFAVVCAFFWAVYTVGGRRIVKKYDPFIATAYLTLMGTAMLAPFAVAEAWAAGPPTMVPSFVFAALYLGILCTVIGYVLWFKALTGLKASSVGASLYFEPVVTIVFAWIIFGQGIGWVAAAGGLVVLFGVLMISRR